MAKRCDVPGIHAYDAPAGGWEAPTPRKRMC